MKIYRIITAILLCSCSKYQSEDQQLIVDVQNKRNWEMIRVLELEMETTKYQVRRQTAKYSRKAYYPIYPIILELKEDYDLITEDYEKIRKVIIEQGTANKELDNFYDVTEKTLLRSIFRYECFFSTFGRKPLGLREKEIYSRTDYFEGKISENLTYLKTMKNKRDNLEYWFNDWFIDLSLKIYNVIMELNTYYLSDRFVFSEFYPIVISENCPIKQGENFEAEIILAYFFEDVNPSDIIFRLDDKVIPFEEDGKALISIEPKNIGTNTIEMTYQLKNPNTTDVDIGSSIYYYEVLPK